MRLFVTAIGTGCGKTITSAIICEALKADYWKPVQSGTEEIDRETVQTLVTNATTTFFPERYLLKTPVSPHAAAQIDGIDINLDDFVLPETKNHLVIEGAGGVLVPVNYNGVFVIDFAKKFNAEVVLVSNLYLGSINHTLLTVNELRSRKIPVKGIIFNGESNPASEEIILKLTGLPCLLRIDQEEEFTKELVAKYASALKI